MKRNGSAIWMAAALGLAAGCGGNGGRPDAAGPAVESPALSAAQTAISGERALEEVRALVELGPRDAGTDGALRAAEHLRGRLEALGIAAEIQEFHEKSPEGPETPFRNVIGRIPGTSDRILMLGSHFDTKAGIEPFEGANDSGSSTGLLLELGRGLAADAPHPMEIWLVFFDGEECMVRYGPRDGFHGSQHLAATLADEGRLADVSALILMDMVGDRNLNVTIGRNNSPELVALAFEAARAEGVRRHFTLYPGHILDDHVAFLERGVPAINLIDFHFGSAPGKNDWWHTPEDSMDKLSAESLEIVGRVVRRMAAERMRAPAAK